MTFAKFLLLEAIMPNGRESNSPPEVIQSVSTVWAVKSLSCTRMKWRRHAALRASDACPKAIRDAQE